VHTVAGSVGGGAGGDCAAGAGGGEEEQLAQHIAAISPTPQ
jgi:hypothetical protein